MKLLAIDPGTQWSGVAVFDMATKRLFTAKRIRGPGWREQLPNVVELATSIIAFASAFAPYAKLVLEWPQVYKGDPTNPNNLLPLAGLDAAVALGLGPHMTDDSSVDIVLPRQWKGNTKKAPAARAILDQLDEQEQILIEDLEEFVAALEHVEKRGTDLHHPTHNTMDAVGIGLQALGRFHPKFVKTKAPPAELFP